MTGNALRPYATAIRRLSGTGSAPANRLVPVIAATRTIQRILDFGCGHGSDVAFFRAQGYDAVGYDNYEPFGYAVQPEGLFDLVTLTYVLNVLPSPDERLSVLGEAAEFMTPEGMLLVVTRSAQIIHREAKRLGWSLHSDGYWSSRSKRTFQHGLTEAEICGLAQSVDLQFDPLTAELPAIPGAARVGLRRAGR